MRRVVSLTGAEASILNALLKLGGESGKLISFKDIRAKTSEDIPSKALFDKAAFELSRADVIAMHRHDHPNSLSPSERQNMVAKYNGKDYDYYVGAALR